MIFGSYDINILVGMTTEEWSTSGPIDFDNGYIVRLWLNNDRDGGVVDCHFRKHGDAERFSSELEKELRQHWDTKIREACSQTIRARLSEDDTQMLMGLGEKFFYRPKEIVQLVEWGFRVDLIAAFIKDGLPVHCIRDGIEQVGADGDALFKFLAEKYNFVW